MKTTHQLLLASVVSSVIRLTPGRIWFRNSGGGDWTRPFWFYWRFCCWSQPRHSGLDSSTRSACWLGCSRPALWSWHSCSFLWCCSSSTTRRRPLIALRQSGSNRTRQSSMLLGLPLGAVRIRSGYSAWIKMPCRFSISIVKLWRTHHGRSRKTTDFIFAITVPAIS